MDYCNLGIYDQLQRDTDPGSILYKNADYVINQIIKEYMQFFQDPKDKKMFVQNMTSGLKGMSLAKIRELLYKQIQPQVQRYILFQFANTELFSRRDQALAKLSQSNEELKKVFRKTGYKELPEPFFLPSQSAEYNRWKADQERNRNR